MSLNIQDAIFESFIGEIVNTGVEIGKNFFKDKIDEVQLKKCLENYIKERSKFNETSSLDEEIDFDALVQYVHNNLLSDVENMVFNSDKKIRGQARNNIANKVAELSGAKTEKSKSRVKNIILSAIDIIKNFYKEKISREQYIIEDEIIEEINERAGKTEEKIAAHSKHTDSKLDKIIDQLTETAVFSPAHLQKLSKANDITSIEDSLSLSFAAINCVHPLKGYYKYEYSNGQLFSQPLSKDAIEKYPPKMVCSGNIFMGSTKWHNDDESIFDYANRHQLEIKFSIEEAKKYLGDIPDPSQHEAENLIGSTLVYKPKPFPPALPCCLKVNGITIYEYIELRTTEILDDGTYIIDNTEQNDIDTIIKLTFNFKDPSHKINYTINVNGCSTEERIKFENLMKSGLEGCHIAIYALKQHKNLIEGDVKIPEYDSGFPSVDEKIDFLERIQDIESYFNKELNYARDIYTNDLSLIHYLSELIRGNSVEWDHRESFEFHVDITDNFKEQLKENNNEPSIIWLLSNITAKLFDEEFSFNIARCFKSVPIKDYEKVKEKVKAFEEGDKIRLTYIVVGEKKVEDHLIEGDLDSYDSIPVSIHD